MVGNKKFELSFIRREEFPPRSISSSFFAPNYLLFLATLEDPDSLETLDHHNGNATVSLLTMNFPRAGPMECRQLWSARRQCSCNRGPSLHTSVTYMTRLECIACPPGRASRFLAPPAVRSPRALLLTAVSQILCG